MLPKCRLILLHEHKKHSTLQCVYSVQTESHEDPIENLGHRQKDLQFLESLRVNQLKNLKKRHKNDPKTDSPYPAKAGYDEVQPGHFWGSFKSWTKMCLKF